MTCKVIIKHEVLKEEKTLTVEGLGCVSFNESNVVLSRHGYDMQFLTMAKCIKGVDGGFSYNRTWVMIPLSIITNILVQHLD